MNTLLEAIRRALAGRSLVRAPAVAGFLGLIALGLAGCSGDALSSLGPDGTASTSAEHAENVPRVVGSLIRAPHSWPIVNWSTIRGLNVTLDEDGEPHGTYDLDIEIDFGDGPFLQETTEEVICLEIAERGDGTTDVWMSSAAEGWVTVAPGVTHYAITHIEDSPGGDRLTARSILLPVDGEPSEFCETRPDLSATDPTGLGEVFLMPAEAGNVVSLPD